MSIGASGRIVIEIDPNVKKMLYHNLKDKGLSLKQWFLIQAEKQLTEDQLSLNFKDPSQNK